MRSDPVSFKKWTSSEIIEEILQVLMALAQRVLPLLGYTVNNDFLYLAA